MNPTLPLSLPCRHSNEYGYDGKINELYPEEVGVRMKPLKDGQLQQHYLVSFQTHVIDYWWHEMLAKKKEMMNCGLSVTLPAQDLSSQLAHAFLASHPPGLHRIQRIHQLPAERDF